ncbi:rCG21291 [Rattus norvegicus]|uniref:RCG21291 n=1 Tax=Rattus norvegicus TaxID=10116 RepID=A6J278_RAT|nr:rCG21291 [Rattus norvegicus]
MEDGPTWQPSSERCAEFQRSWTSQTTRRTGLCLLARRNSVTSPLRDR